MRGGSSWECGLPTIARETLAVPAMAHEVAEGLLRTCKSLPPKLFYDEAGSALFEQITELPEYYVTRTEMGILRKFSHEIAHAVAPVAAAIELGAGTSTKTKLLLSAILGSQPALTFFPVDISAAPLRMGQAALQCEFPQLHVVPVVTDFLQNLSFLAGSSPRRLVFYLGSSIGNFEPLQAVSLLCRLRRRLAPGDLLLVGFDMRKDPEILHAAYDDAQRVTAAFNKNVLARINRELGGHFDLEAFRHVALWNDHESRIEMHLQAGTRQAVRIDQLGISVEFERGETIHTENSYKYSDAMIAGLLRNSGFSLVRTWKDDRGWFSETLARV